MRVSHTLSRQSEDKDYTWTCLSGLEDRVVDSRAAMPDLAGKLRLVIGG